jgi:hypothetical protein
MSKSTTSTHEGQEALKRFREALKTVVSVPKSTVIAQEKALHKTRKPAKPKG